MNNSIDLTAGEPADGTSEAIQAQQAIEEVSNFLHFDVVFVQGNFNQFSPPIHSFNPHREELDD